LDNTTKTTECKSRTRDKYNKCVECGIEIFSGMADYVLLNDDGIEIKRISRFTWGHVD